MFANKVVLITGASSGIGAQTAIDFSKEGANLALTGRNKVNLENVATQCQENSPNKLQPLVIIADISKESDIKDLMKKTIDHFEKLDVLVNNAGIALSGGIDNTSLEQYDETMNTNVRGALYLTMLATPYLIKTKGSIINVSSVDGLRALSNSIAYCTSKAALDQFTRCLALELGPKGVRVNSVNPGDIETGIHLKGLFSKEEYKEYLTKKVPNLYPIGRVGNSQEVSSVIVFLASKGGSNITGVALPVDGGYTATGYFRRKEANDVMS